MLDIGVLPGAVLVSLGGPRTLRPKGGLQDSSASRTSPVGCGGGLSADIGGQDPRGGLSRYLHLRPFCRVHHLTAQSGLRALPEVPPLASGSRLSSDPCFPTDRMERASRLTVHTAERLGAQGLAGHRGVPERDLKGGLPLVIPRLG